MNFLFATLLLVAGSDGETAEQPQMRTWTDIQGREIVALFVDFKDGEVHLKKKHDGKLYRCPLERLSQPDQEYATRQTLPPEDIRPTPRERWKEYRDRKTGERFIVKQLDRVVMPGGIRKVYIELENGLRYWIVEQHYEVSDPGDRRGPGRDPGKGEKRLGPPVIDVVVEGFGSDPGEAIQEALSQAIEQAVGVLVDSETQVVGDTITRDEILTWSRGFVQGYRAVKRWQEEGLHYVLIVASVTKEKLVEGLKEKQLEVRALPGDVIAYRLLHERRAREDAARMIREVLEDASMDRLCTATLINNPIDEAFEFERDENQAGLPVRVRVSVDQDQQGRLYEQLRMLLDHFAYRQNEFTLTAEARTEDSWYVVPTNSTEIEQAYYRLYYPVEPGPEREIICLCGDRLESGMTSRWDAFLVDKPIYEEFADVYHRQCEVQIELADGDNNVLSRTRLSLPANDRVRSRTKRSLLANDRDPPHMSGQLRAEWYDTKWTKISAPALGPFVWQYRRFVGWHYSFSFEIEGTATLGIDKLKDVRQWNCSIERAQGGDASGPRPRVGIPGGGRMGPLGTEETRGGGRMGPLGTEGTRGGPRMGPLGTEETRGGPRMGPLGTEETPGGPRITPRGTEEIPGMPGFGPPGTEEMPGIPGLAPPRMPRARTRLRGPPGVMRGTRDSG